MVSGAARGSQPVASSATVLLEALQADVEFRTGSLQVPPLSLLFLHSLGEQLNFSAARIEKPWLCQPAEPGKAHSPFQQP